MKRRQLLKNLGYGAGALVVTPAVMSLLQSCENTPVFTPVFLSPAQGHALKSMVALIIPNDEKVPGAVEVGVHEFIDKYWKEVLPANKSEVEDEFWEVSPTREQPFMKNLWTTFEENYKTTFQKELADGTPEEFDQILSKYLKTDKSTQTAYGKKMGEFSQAYKLDPTIQPDKEAAMFNLLATVRGMTMWGWKSSETIGKNVLWYDPVPGQQIGCLPLSEAGNGKAMAL